MTEGVRYLERRGDDDTRFGGIAAFPPTDAEVQLVKLTLAESGVQLKRFLSYRFNSDFLTPTDGWEFEMAGDQIDPATEKLITEGQEIALSVNNNVQMTGIIDSIEVEAAKGSGTKWKIDGRDLLGQVVDSHADPKLQLKPEMTLEDLITQVFGPLGWDASHVELDDRASLAAKTNIDFSRKTPKRPRKSLKSRRCKFERPNPEEGAFAFASRVAQRYGLAIWLSADGKKLIVGEPDYDTPPVATLIRKRDGSFVNVLSGKMKKDLTDQPLCIFAEGFGGGGEWGKSKLQILMPNPAVAFQTGGTANPEFEKIQKKHEKAVLIEPSYYPSSKHPQLNRAKPLYLHDDASHDLEHLERFVRKEMSQRVRKAFVAHYKVFGHHFANASGQIFPWAVNTNVRVEDEVLGISETLWIKSVHYQRARGSGTVTDLELLRQHAISF